MDLRVKQTDRRVRGYAGRIEPAAGLIEATVSMTGDHTKTKQKLKVADKSKKRPFLAQSLHCQGENIIFGLPWLTQMDPHINFKTRTITLKHEDNSVTLNVQPEQKENKQQGSNTNNNSIITNLMELATSIEEEENGISEGAMQQYLRSSNQESDYVKKKKGQLKSKEAKAIEDKLLKEFKDVFADELPFGAPPSRGHELRIKVKPNSRPPAKTASRLNPRHSKFADKWIKEMLEKGKIRRSQSEYAAPHFYVDKPESTETGEYRAVTHFRALNDITVKNTYPLPRTDELFDKMANAKYFSKIDLRTGVYQIGIAEEDKHKTAFITSQGLFEYNVLPMGLGNSPAIFMQLMNDTFRENLNKFVLVCLDDIIVYSDTLEEHERHLRWVMQKLREQKLYAELSKSELCVEEVTFLGHYIGKDGVRVMEDKIEAVRDWPTPKSVKDLRAFLGIVGYYRKFVQGFSKIALPITDLVKKSITTNFDQYWKTEQQLAFITL